MMTSSLCQTCSIETYSYIVRVLEKSLKIYFLVWYFPVVNPRVCSFFCWGNTDLYAALFQHRVLVKSREISYSANLRWKVHICIDYTIVHNKKRRWLGVCSQKVWCFIDWSEEVDDIVDFIIDIYSITFWADFLLSKKFLAAMFSLKKPIMQILAANILIGIFIVKKLYSHSQTWQIKFVFFWCKKVHSMFRLGAYESYSRTQEAIWPRFALLMTPDQLQVTILVSQGNWHVKSIVDCKKYNARPSCPLGWSKDAWLKLCFGSRNSNSTMLWSDRP